MARGRETRWTTALILYGDSNDSMTLASSPPQPASSSPANDAVRLSGSSLPTGVTHPARRCVVCPHPRLFLSPFFPIFNRGFSSLRGAAV